MASEDSVKYGIDRLLSPFPIRVHRIGDLNDPGEASAIPMHIEFEHLQDATELPIVIPARAHFFHVDEQWYHSFSKNITRLDGVHQHVRIVLFGTDPSVSEVLLSHFEELTSVPMLVNEKHRLYVVAEGRGRVSPHGDTDASFTFDHAG